MIKFFRNIRQQQLSDGNFSKYLLYALGEIVLVVIGILIALQINAWSEARKERKSEAQVLTTVLKELKLNEQILAKEELDLLTYLSSTKQFINLMSPNPADSSLLKVGKYLADGTEVVKVQLHLAGIRNLVSNKMELISNDSLAQMLIDYPILFDRYKVMEDLQQNISTNRIRPRIKQYISLGSAAFTSDYKGLLSDRILANDLMDRLWEMDEFKKEFMELRINGQLLIRIIEEHLKTL